MEPETAKPKCHCVCRKFVVAIVVILIVGAICCHVHRPHWRWNGPKVGTECTVQFDTGAVVFISGTLVDVKRDAIFLQTVEYEWNQDQQVSKPNAKLMWIPKKNILFIQYKDEKIE